MTAEIGRQPVTTKTDVFVYEDTILHGTTPLSLSPHVRIGVMGEGIDLFFMGGRDTDAIASLNRFVNFVSEYRDGLLAREAEENRR